VTGGRKRILPEVLPAPTALPVDSPRERIMDHLRRLRTVAAAGATLAACETSSGEEPAMQQQGAAASASTVPQATSAAPAATGQPVAERRPDRGYSVVDPMPYPARCGGATPSFHATARWLKPTVLEARIRLPSSVTWDDQSRASTGVEAKLIQTRVMKGLAVVQLEIDPAEELNEVGFGIKAACKQEHVMDGRKSVFAEFAVLGPSGAPLKPGSPVSVVQRTVGDRGR
jgi:hypothetical protein